jgi:phospholipase/carboxylesterase
VRPWLLLLLLVGACQRVAPPPAATDPAPTVERLELPSTSPTDAPLEVVERWVGGAAPGDDVPIVVMVHGLGDDPGHFAWVAEGWPTPARMVLPRGPIPFGKGFAWMTMRSDEGRDEDLAVEIAEAAGRVAALCNDLAGTDASRKPVVAGFSQGAMVAYAVAVRHPESVSGAVPVSGWLPEPLWPVAGQPVAPVRALHGTRDTVIDIGRAERTVQALRAAGADAGLERFEGVGHVIPRPMRTRLQADVAQLAAGP